VEEEEQVGCAEQQDAGDLLGDAERSVASEATMPTCGHTRLVFGLRKVHSCAAVHQSRLGVAQGPSADQTAIAQAWQPVTIT
jgi:hypothetical protein